jgi:hypothetical protein
LIIMTLRTATVLLAAAVTGAGLLTVPAAGAAEAADPAPTAVPFDLDGNGRADVVSGLPLRGSDDAGAVLVLWGGRELVPETMLTHPGTPTPGQEFGISLASADFDQDGVADLAVGGQGTESVTVFFGSRTRALTARTLELDGRGAGHYGFGASLAAGDMDGDGWPELVVGAIAEDALPDEDYGSGAVVVLQGGPAGLDLHRSSTVARPERAMASFGALVALGDLDGDGDLDLVEGYRGGRFWVDDPPAPPHVTYALSGPSAVGAAQVLSRRSAASIAVGDLTRDGRADVVVGSDFRTTYTEDDPLPRGRVTVFPGTAAGPSPAGIAISQRSTGVPGRDERGDRFGASVALTDVDRDGHLDLVVGSPGEDGARGRLTILRGTRRGVSPRDAVTLDQGSPEIPGRPETDDQFGARVAALDVNGDGRNDLVVGSTGEDHFRGLLTVVELRGIFYTRRGVRSYSLASIGQGGRGLGAALGG